MRSSCDLIWCWPVSVRKVKLHSLGCMCLHASWIFQLSLIFLRASVAALLSSLAGTRSILSSVTLMLPPEQVAELLPWYMQWSRDLAAEMHQRHLVQDKARRTLTLPAAYCPCDCTTEWRCEPHGACFIHDSCFCPGSGSFPPVKPPRS